MQQEKLMGNEILPGLKTFLQALNKEDAQRVWDYLDENPHALDEMIEIVAPIADPTVQQKSVN